jgi:hypothetical protein
MLIFSIYNDPESGISNPANTLRSVVLPHPDGPIIEKNSPSKISKSISLIASQVP